MLLSQEYPEHANNCIELDFVYPLVFIQETLFTARLSCHRERCIQEQLVGTGYRARSTCTAIGGHTSEGPVPERACIPGQQVYQFPFKLWINVL